MPVEERFWTHRLRWRLRGASWLWPAFGLAVLVDAAILHFLPPVGSEQQINAPAGLNLVGDLIVAGFTNLFLVAVIAPWLARRLTARPVPEGAPVPPYELHYGRTAAILMAVAGFGLVIVGLGNRPLIVSETKATQTAAQTLRAWVNEHGNAEQRQRISEGIANTARVSSGFFRACIPTRDLSRSTCFFIDTNKDPATIKRDPDMRNNAPLSGG